jgi:hypothetical protein
MISPHDNGFTPGWRPSDNFGDFPTDAMETEAARQLLDAGDFESLCRYAGVNFKRLIQQILARQDKGFHEATEQGLRVINAASVATPIFLPKLAEAAARYFAERGWE